MSGSILQSRRAPCLRGPSYLGPYSILQVKLPAPPLETGLHEVAEVVFFLTLAPAVFSLTLAPLGGFLSI